MYQGLAQIQGAQWRTKKTEEFKYRALGAEEKLSKAEATIKDLTVQLRASDDYKEKLRRIYFDLKQKYDDQAKTYKALESEKKSAKKSCDKHKKRGWTSYEELEML